MRNRPDALCPQSNCEVTKVTVFNFPFSRVRPHFFSDTHIESGPKMQAYSPSEFQGHTQQKNKNTTNRLAIGASHIDRGWRNRDNVYLLDFQ